MFSLELSEIQRAVADTVGSFCRENPASTILAEPEERLPAAWRALGQLGVFSLAGGQDQGGMLEATTALEGLGSAGFPGPLAASFLATDVLDTDAAAAVASGEKIVTFGPGPLIPWARLADLMISLDDECLVLVEPDGDIETVATVGGEPWGRCDLKIVGQLATGDPLLNAFARYDTALAAYTIGLARELVRRATEHVATRRQFGRALGEFQAVAHPLADCTIKLSAGSTLAARAAFAIDHDEDDRPRRAAASWMWAREAAVEAITVCHQAFGAMGITLEGPVYELSRRIRQTVSQEQYRQECLAELMIEPLAI